MTETEIEQLLYDELKLNGYQATFHTLGTTHMGLNQPAQLRILVDSMLADR